MKRAAAVSASLLFCGCVFGIGDHITGEARANAIRRIGRPATAYVLQIWDTGVSVNDNPVVGFRLEVHAEGLAPFTAETKALIGRLDVPRIQPGAVLSVKYDPADPTRVALDIYEEK